MKTIIEYHECMNKYCCPHLLNNDMGVQECDARKIHSSNADWLIIKNIECFLNQ